VAEFLDRTPAPSRFLRGPTGQAVKGDPIVSIVIRAGRVSAPGPVAADVLLDGEIISAVAALGRLF